MSRECRFESEAQLRDYGERWIIANILRPRYSSSGLGGLIFGDDCAALRWPIRGGVLTVTTDPCPLPAAHLLGFTDPYYYGWLLATINLSDLAASGCEPLGLVTSLELPSDMSLSDFVRLLDGIDDCAATCGAHVIGGNLKESLTINLTATALGFSSTDAMARSRARVGDVVCVAGEMGRFWAGFLALSRGGEYLSEVPSTLTGAVLCPVPLVGVGRALKSAGVETCMDNSDGLLASLRILAAASSVQIRVDLDAFRCIPEVKRVGEVLKVDWRRFCLGWGDWNLLLTTSRARFEDARAVCEEEGACLVAIGEVASGSGVVMHSGERSGPPMGLDSERFTADSWLSSGIEGYIAQMLTAPIIAE